jgi:DNA-binding response OmpR family regulator
MVRDDTCHQSILIVDDNPANIGIIMRFLKDVGFRILVARDGSSAIEIAKYEHPDLILLDILMPGMNGFETCEKLKLDPSTQEIPVIFVTALSDTVDTMKGFKVGGVDYITKPFKCEEVIARIQTHLSLSMMKKLLKEQNDKLEEEVCERKLAEEALQKANVELEQRISDRTYELSEMNRKNLALIHAIPDIIMVISQYGYIKEIHVNDITRLSWPAEQLLGKQIVDIGLDIVSEKMFLENVHAAITSSRLQVFEYTVQLPSGIRDFEARIISLTKEEVLGIIRDITERKKTESALTEAKRKLSALNEITFSDIKSAIFILSSYFSLIELDDNPGSKLQILGKIRETLSTCDHLIDASKIYQDLGTHAPLWLNVKLIFLYAISHNKTEEISIEGDVENLEIFVDPLLERVFTGLVENAIEHGEKINKISLSYIKRETDLLLILEDDGVGVPDDQKKMIFERCPGTMGKFGLWLIREILDISGITIQECGIPDNGARFEMVVPAGSFRFQD